MCTVGVRGLFQFSFSKLDCCPRCGKDNFEISLLAIGMVTNNENATVRVFLPAPSLVKVLKMTVEEFFSQLLEDISLEFIRDEKFIRGDGFHFLMVPIPHKKGFSTLKESLASRN